MSVQLCEGIWRNRSGQRLVITQCKPDDDGQQWTDGGQRYSDNGSFYGPYGGCSEQDLVEYIGLLPDKSQPDQQAKIELLRTTLTQQTAEIARLQAERQTEFTTAQQLRAENESLTVRLQRAEIVAAEALQKWETTEQVCLKIITALAGVRS